MESIDQVRDRHMTKLVEWTMQDVALLVGNPAHVSITADGHQLRVSVTDAGKTWLAAELSKRARDALHDVEHATSMHSYYGVSAALGRSGDHAS